MLVSERLEDVGMEWSDVYTPFRAYVRVALEADRDKWTVVYAEGASEAYATNEKEDVVVTFFARLDGEDYGDSDSWTFGRYVSWLWLSLDCPRCYAEGVVDYLVTLSESGEMVSWERTSTCGTDWRCEEAVDSMDEDMKERVADAIPARFKN